jgi:hypothetical protein
MMASNLFYLRVTDFHSFIRWSIQFIVAILKDSYMRKRSPSINAIPIERSLLSKILKAICPLLLPFKLNQGTHLPLPLNPKRSEKFAASIQIQHNLAAKASIG